MAQVKLLKIVNGLPTEFDSSADDVTLASFGVTGGPVVSATGVDMNGTDASEMGDISFTDPAVGTVNGIIANDIMDKAAINEMAITGAIQFGAVTDDADELSSFLVPQVPGVPTAVPTAGEGSMVYDSTNGDLYVYNGSSWDNMNISESAENIESGYLAGEAIGVGKVVYISAANKVSLGDNTNDAKRGVMGVAATAAAAADDPIFVKKAGTAEGFTGLTAGARMYLSTAGAVTATPPSGSSHNIVQVGFARSATEIDLQFQFLGKRA